MHQGHNMFTNNLNHRFYTINRNYRRNTVPVVAQPRTSLHNAHAYVNNAKARVPRAFGKSMYSNPPSGGGCGCGK